MAQPTTDYKTRFQQRDSYTLQPLDDTAVPVRCVGWLLRRGLPNSGRWRGLRLQPRQREAGDGRRREPADLEALAADADWMRRHVLAAVLDNASWNYSDEQHGTLAVQPLANNDAVTYVKRSGQTATDNHYLAQAGPS
jgi:hypothetical protein